MRPLERGGGKISVPLGFDTGKDAVVEVVSVQAKAIPAGRSELALDVPRVAVPVQEHRWRLLLPDGARYRFRSGDLRPAVDLEKLPTARDPWRPAEHPRCPHRPHQRRRQRVGPAVAVRRSRDHAETRSCAAGSPTTGARPCRG